MEFDLDKGDEITLALLWLTSFKNADGVRAWKGQDWETMDRLYSKGYLSDPKSKAKSRSGKDWRPLARNCGYDGVH